jgi:splicing factor 45
MVGPGEVDEDLESETAEECTKYGPVVRCKIYEEKNPMVPSDKSVRIFVQFTTLDSALKGTPVGTDVIWARACLCGGGRV